MTIRPSPEILSKPTLVVEQPSLFNMTPKPPPVTEGIALRCGGVHELVRDRKSYADARLVHVDVPADVALSVVKNQLQTVADAAPRCETALVWLAPKQLGEWLGSRALTGWKFATQLSLHYLDPEAGAVRYGVHDCVLVYQRKRGRGLPEGMHTWSMPAQTAAMSAIPGRTRPVPWLQRWLNHWTKEGELVLDLYGRGEMAEACLWQKRRYLGAVAEPDMLAHVQHRLNSIYMLLNP